MLIRFGFENFKSFDDRQELVLILAKKLKINKDHVILLNKVSVLRNATIYGANTEKKYFEGVHNNRKDLGTSYNFFSPFS